MKAVRQLAEYFLYKRQLTVKQVRAYHADGVFGDKPLDECLALARSDDPEVQAAVADLVLKLKSVNPATLRKLARRAHP